MNEESIIPVTSQVAAGEFAAAFSSTDPLLTKP